MHWNIDMKIIYFLIKKQLSLSELRALLEVVIHPAH